MTARCRCRPGCLSTLREADDVVITGDGAALAEHLYDVPSAQESLFDLAEVTA